MASDKEIKFLQDNCDFAGLKQAKLFDKNIKDSKTWFVSANFQTM